MNIFNGDLKAVETAGFWRCDFDHEVATEILVDDAVGRRKEGKNMHDEVLFCCRESVPVYSVAREVYFFSSPKGGFGLLIHPPDVIVLDGEENKAMRVCLEERLRSEGAYIFGILVLQDLSI